MTHLRFTMIAVLSSFASLTFADTEGTELQTKLHLDLVTATEMHPKDPDYASELYTSVLEQSSSDADISIAAYNMGLIALDKKDYPRAIELFSHAGKYTSDRQLRRNTMFNLGHAIILDLNHDPENSDQTEHMSQAIDAAAGISDPAQIDQRIETLDRSQRAFLDAARSDPQHHESKRNVHRIRKQIKTLKDIKEQLERQQQESQSQNQQEQQYITRAIT